MSLEQAVDDGLVPRPLGLSLIGAGVIAGIKSDHRPVIRHAAGREPLLLLEGEDRPVGRITEIAGVDWVGEVTQLAEPLLERPYVTARVSMGEGPAIGELDCG